MKSCFLKRPSILILILFQTIGILQGASESNSPTGPISLQEMAMHRLLHNLVERGKTICAANYTQMINEEKVLCANMGCVMGEKYHNLAITSFGWTQAPLFLKAFKPFNEATVTALHFTNNTELCITSSKKQLSKINVENNVMRLSDTTQLEANGRNIAQSSDKRFLAILLHARKIFIWDKEANIQTTFFAPVIRIRDKQTALNQIMFDPIDNALICTIHNTPTVFRWSIEELFSDAPKGYFLRNDAQPQNNLPKAFCVGKGISIETRTTRYNFPTYTQPKRIAYSPDYRYLAAAMQDGIIGIWHFPNILYYLLQCAINNTLQNSNPSDYVTLIETLQNEQSGPYSALPDHVKNNILLGLQNQHTKLTAAPLIDDNETPSALTLETSEFTQTRKRIPTDHETAQGTAARQRTG